MRINDSICGSLSAPGDNGPVSHKGFGYRALRKALGLCDAEFLDTLVATQLCLAFGPRTRSLIEVPQCLQRRYLSRDWPYGKGYPVGPTTTIGSGCSMIRSLRCVTAALRLLIRARTLSDTVSSCEQLSVAATHTRSPVSFYQRT